LVFLRSCQYQLVIATLAAERGHITDSFQATRRAVESCAFGCKVSAHPHLAETWLEAGRSDEAYEKYQDKFSNKKLFPSGDQLLSLLYERYDHASKHMHSSVYSMARRLRPNEDQSGILVDFHYFEIDQERNQGEPFRTLLWTWDTHFHMIKAFERSLPILVSSAAATWQLRLTSVEAALTYHKSRWKKLVTSGPSESPTHEDGSSKGS
jgi:hypothetical protein